MLGCLWANDEQNKVDEESADAKCETKLEEGHRADGNEQLQQDEPHCSADALEVRQHG